MRFFFILIAFSLLVSCQEEKTTESDEPTLAVSTINPNGDSELALLMREMFDHGMRMKKAIKSGEKVVVERNFKELLTAQATEPEKAASHDFKSFGQAYISIMEKMEEAPDEDVKELYNDMVNNCMACHTAFCPGPKMRIKHLILK